MNDNDPPGVAERASIRFALTLGIIWGILLMQLFQWLFGK